MMSHELVAAAIALMLASTVLSLVLLSWTGLRSISTFNLNDALLNKLPDVSDDHLWDGVPYDSYDGLLWFIQITDLHFSKYRGPERVSDLEDFCIWMRMYVKPPIVLATGDLVDGKNKDHLGSTQYEEEWSSYGSTVRNFCLGVPGTTTWLDVRGNHDTFDVASDDSRRNYFQRYSVQGAEGGRRRSYLHLLNHQGRKYAFVGIDATLSPGPKRPFNFFGALTRYHTEEIGAMLELAAAENDAGLIAFGHYPLSTVISPHPGIKSLIGKVGADAYVSGHLHDLSGLVSSLYAKQPEGYLELELSDWKNNRKFRMAALDRGHFSFADGTFAADENIKASVLITNPLDATFVYGSKMRKAVKTMRESTHVRVLVFSSAKILSVIVEIDGENEVLECQVKENDSSSPSPLYVARWFPANYTDGNSHNLTVSVRVEGLQAPLVSSRRFVLDVDSLAEQTIEEFGFVQRLVLISDLSTVIRISFGVSLSVIVMTMCLLRLLHHLTLKGQLHRVQQPAPNSMLLSRFLYHAVKSIWVTSNLDAIYYPTVSYLLYVTVGPLGIGYLSTDGIGVMFSWGTVLGGTWLPTYTTYAYLCYFMAPYWYAALIGAAWTVNQKHNEALNNQICVSSSFCRCLCKNVWFIVLMAMQALHCVEFYMSYGLLASFSVCGIFRCVSLYYLWSKAVAVRQEDFLKADLIKIWSPKK